MQETRIDRYSMADFLVLPTSAGACPMGYVETSTSGNADVKAVGDGHDLILSNDNEIQNLCISRLDNLKYPIDKLNWIEMIVELTWASTFPTEVTAVWGLGSARNDDPDAVAANAFFKVAGSAAVVCESDDGTRDNDDKATGQTMATGKPRRFVIDFKEGIQTVGAPGQSKGGKGNVIFKMEDASGALRRVCESTLFDMSGYSLNLQQLIQVQKTASTSVVTVTVKEIAVEYVLAT